MLNILASFAQFERSLIAERVRAGMDRAKRQGKHVGRPLALNGNLKPLLPAIRSGALSVRAAARRLGVNHTTVARALVRKGCPNGASEILVSLDVPSAQ